MLSLGYCNKNVFFCRCVFTDYTIKILFKCLIKRQIYLMLQLKRTIKTHQAGLNGRFMYSAVGFFGIFVTLLIIQHVTWHIIVSKSCTYELVSLQSVLLDSSKLPVVYYRMKSDAACWAWFLHMNIYWTQDRAGYWTNWLTWGCRWGLLYVSLYVSKIAEPLQVNTWH